jgi:O-antigen/teichoic acid export membrane protein
MTEITSSYRRILKNSSIIGGSSVANVGLGLIRTKALALILGPAGMGVASLYIGFLNTAGTLATMGLGTVGTRQIAESFSKEDARAVAVARRAMFWGTMVLAGVAMLAVWSLRSVLAVWILGSSSYAPVIGWLAIGVGLLVAAASQSALLQGTYRIGDLARVTIWASILNVALGVAFLWKWGQHGLIGYVLVGPLATFAVGHFYVSRLPKSAKHTIAWSEVTRQWSALLRLGVAYVGGGLSLTLTQLWIRIFVGKALGRAPLGQYQAAWTISMYYVSFILTAMAADYYPRLTAVVHEHDGARRLVNEQSEIALLLSAPVFVAMMALAPWVMHLLYSVQFAPAVDLLRWQILGDVLKVASWPLGFVILAAGDGKTFFWTECATNLLTAILIVTLAPVVGLRITGIAYLATYLFYLPLVFWLARRRIAFSWSPPVYRLVLGVFTACGAVWLLALVGRCGMLIGAAVAVWLAVFALGRISHMGALGGPVGRLGDIARRWTHWRRA